MVQTVLKSLFWIVGILAFSTMIIVGVTDPAVFHQHFYGDTQFDLFSFVGDLWPRPILIAVGSICVMFALGSDRLHCFLGSVAMPGAALMSLIFLACVVATFS